MSMMVLMRNLREIFGGPYDHLLRSTKFAKMRVGRTYPLNRYLDDREKASIVSNKIQFLHRRKIPGTVTIVQLLGRLEYFGWRCRWCGCSLEDDFEVEVMRSVWGDKLFVDTCVNQMEIDHVIPVSRGGTNWPANLVPSCIACNLRKNRRDWREFIASMAMQQQAEAISLRATRPPRKQQKLH